jgi:hypothetical protein
MIDQEKLDNLKLEALSNRISDADEKRTAQLRMTWVALSGMVLYPVIVLTANGLGLDKASQQLTDLASIYIVSVSGLVAAYFAMNRPDKVDKNASD